jgi:membrane fusion protein, macrolide-specific efflux system
MPTQDTLIKTEPRAAPPIGSSRGEPGGRAGRVLTALGRHRMLAAGLACVAALGVAYAVYSWKSDTSGSPILVTAARGDVENLVTAIGNLQPLNTVDVGAQVSGQLKTLHAKIGDDIRKGELVAEIDTPVAAAKVDADRAQLQNLRAQLLDKQASRTLTAAQAGRQTRLKDAGATSQDAFDIAQSAQRSGAAQVKALQAQITQAESTLKADQATLGYGRIYAPMTGTVTAIQAKEGQTLNANQQAPTILTISDLTTMTVYTQVSEADIPKLRLGMDAYFMTLGNATRRYTGKLRQILPTPTVVNNVVLYTALFDVANPGKNLMPQMTAQVFFVLGAAHDVVVIPVAALNFSDAAQPRAAAPSAQARRTGPPRRAATVTVVLPSGAREVRNVVVGISDRVDAEIVSGLAPGEKVIVGTQSPSLAKTARPVTAASVPNASGFGRGGR